MSQENVEVVRRSLAAYRTGDHDSYVEFFAEDVQVCPDAGFPDAQPFRGREKFRRFVADIDQGFEGSATADVGEVLAVGDRVVARADWPQRASGIDLRSSLTSVYAFRDGQITKIEYFFDHAEPSKPPGCPSTAMSQENVSFERQDRARSTAETSRR